MKSIKLRVEDFFRTVFSYPMVQRSLHTFWQTALAVLLVGVTHVHNFTDLQALAAAVIAAALSAVKTGLVAQFSTNDKGA